MSGPARILTVASISGLFLVVFLGTVMAKGFSTNPAATRGEQCELLASTSDPKAAVLEPQNTWSNLGYFLAGTLILYRSRNLLGAAVGLNLAFEFLFSGLYHAKLTETMQTIDVAWIYVLLLSVIAYAIQSLFAREWATKTSYPRLTAPVVTAVIIVLLVIGLGILMGLLKNSLFESTKTTLALVALLFIFLIIAVIVAAVRGGESTAVNLVMTGVVILATGIPTLFFKFSDGAGNRFLFFPNLCCSKADMQAHAAWHILSALMVAIAYDFFANFSGDGRIFSIARPGQEFDVTSEAV